MRSDPMGFVLAGDEVGDAKTDVDDAVSEFLGTAERISQSWSGAGHNAQRRKGRHLARDLAAASAALGWAQMAATDGGRALQALVGELRAMVFAAFDEGFWVHPLTGTTTPGPLLEAQAAAEGPGAPAAMAVYEALAAAITGEITTMMEQANALDAQIAAQLRAAAEQLVGKTPSEQPPGPNLFQPVRATLWQTMTPRQIAVDMAKTYGMPRYNQKLFQEFADERGLIIDVRPTNPDSLKWLLRGALPKPYKIKAKTINAMDERLGAPTGTRGLVGFFVPKEPQESEFGADYAQAVARYEKRVKEQKALGPAVAVLETSGLYRVNNGVFEGRLTVEDEWRQITGDHDIYNIRTRFGDQLPGGEYPRTIVPSAELPQGEPGDPPLPDAPAGAYWKLIQEMEDRQFGVMHGAHAYWNPTDPFERDDVWEPIVKGHRIGAEELIRFQPGLPPTLVYNIAPIELPS